MLFLSVVHFTRNKHNMETSKVDVLKNNFQDDSPRVDFEMDHKDANKNEDKKPVDTKTILHEFCLKTTAHGLGHLAETVYLPLKIFWIIVFLAVSTGNIIQLVTLISNYFAYESKHILSYDQSAPLEFPYVTMCNSNPFSPSNFEVNIYNTSSQTHFYKNFIDGKLHHLIKDLDEAHQHDIKGRLDSPVGYFENIGLQEISEIGHYKNDFIINCTIDGKQCSEKDIIPIHHSTYFNCYTFTGNEILKRNSTLRPGPFGGLSLILFMENTLGTEYKGTYNVHNPVANSAGVRVLIHAPGTVPNILEKGFDVHPGTSTSVGVIAKTFKYLTEPYGKCESKDTFQNGYKYSASECLQSCFREKVLKFCGCHSALLFVGRTDPGNFEDDMTYCGYLNRSAVKDFDNYLKRINCEVEILGYYGNNCECPPLCRQKEYTISSSESLWPAKKYHQDFFDSLIADRPYLKANKQLKKAFNETDMDLDLQFLVYSNFLRLNVYFSAPGVQYSVQKESYGLSSLMSDVGGSLGFWAGMSVITISEFFFVTLWLCIRLKNYLCGGAR